MNGLNNLMKVVAIVGAVALAGVAVGLLVTGGPKEESPSPRPGDGLSATNRAASGVPAPVVAPPARKPVQVTPPKTKLAVAAGGGAASMTITNWEDKLDSILGAETEEPEKARQMLAVFPTLPEDGQVEVAQHLSNLVADEDYAPLAQLTANALLPEMVLDVLISDTLNRPNTLKLPVLLEVARTPQHPKAEEAKDLLELFLEEDYGTDWNTWQTKMEEWLKENPE